MSTVDEAVRQAWPLASALADATPEHPLPPGRYRVPSRTAVGEFYSVLVGLDGNLQCECAGFANRRDCWHVKFIKEEGMTTAIVPIKVQPPASALPTVQEIQSMDMVAARLATSGSVAIPNNLKSESDIRAVILAGWEMGVRPMTALRHLAVINGKTEPDGQLMAGIILAKESDAKFEVVEETETSTTVRFTRPLRNLVREYTVTMADAQKAGLTGGNWAKYPRDMRRWHAIKRLARAYAPDIINGIASVSLGDMPPAVESVDEEPDYIEGEVTTIPEVALYNEGDEEPDPEPEPAKPASEIKAPSDLLKAIQERHGAAAVVKAKGIMPYLYGTGDFLKLSKDDHADFAARLRVWLDEPEHEHVEAYAPDGRAVCGRCGVEVEEPTEQAALI